VYRKVQSAYLAGQVNLSAFSGSISNDPNIRRSCAPSLDKPLSAAHLVVSHKCWGSFGHLNLGHWDLFEPALMRLGLCTPSSAFGMEVEALHQSGVISFWAGDLGFGDWNFHDFPCSANLGISGQLPV